MPAMLIIIRMNNSFLPETEFTLKWRYVDQDHEYVSTDTISSLLVVELDGETDTAEANDCRGKSTALVNVNRHLN